MPKPSGSFLLVEDEKLVDLVAMHPCIYDLGNAMHKDTAVRDKIWKDISRKMCRSESECRKRWKNIRDSYVRLHRKRRRGVITSNCNINRWLLYSRLSFLDYLNDDSTVESKISTAESAPADHSLSTSAMEFVESLENVSQNSPSTSSSSSSESSKEQRRKKRQKLSDRNEREEEDPVHAFFRSMALTVKKLPPELIARARTDIANIVGKYELEALSNQDLNIKYSPKY